MNDQIDYENLPQLPKADFFTNSYGTKLAYIHKNSKKTHLVFLHGYASDMYGSKAMALHRLAQEKDLGFLALEYTGNGSSEGDFIKEGTIGRWADDAFEVIQAKIKGDIILVGSSMGGWLAFLLAQKLKQVKAVIGIAPAPDFTEDIMLQSLGEKGIAEIEEKGLVYEPNDWDPENPTIWTKNLLDEAKNHLVMNKDFHQKHIKIRILQGLADDVVPWHRAIKIAEWLKDNDVELWMPKDGDHRLSTVRDLKKLNQIVSDCLFS